MRTPGIRRERGLFLALLLSHVGFTLCLCYEMGGPAETIQVSSLIALTEVVSHILVSSAQLLWFLVDPDASPRKIPFANTHSVLAPGLSCSGKKQAGVSCSHH